MIHVQIATNAYPDSLMALLLDAVILYLIIVSVVWRYLKI
jgi:hypothetical protein